MDLISHQFYLKPHIKKEKQIRYCILKGYLKPHKIYPISHNFYLKPHNTI
jgi:hypothetical protein